MLRKVIFVIIALLMFDPLPASAASAPVLSIKYEKDLDKKQIKVQVVLDNPTNIAGLQFSVKYDSSKLKVRNEGITAGAALDGYFFSSNVIERNGEIKIAAAGSSGLRNRDSVVIASILFEYDVSADFTPLVIHSHVAGNGEAKRLQTSAKGVMVTLGDEEYDQAVLEMVLQLSEGSAALIGATEKQSLEYISTTKQAAVDAFTYAIQSNNPGLSVILNNAIQEFVSNSIKASANFENEESLSSVHGLLALIMKTADDSLSASVHREVLEHVADTNRKVLHGVGKLIEYAEQADTVEYLVDAIIPSSASVAGKLDQLGGSYNGLERATVHLVEKAVEKAGSGLLVAESGEGAIIAKVDESLLPVVVEGIKVASSVADTLQQRLNDHGITRRAERKLLLAISTPAKSGNHHVQAEFPGMLLSLLDTYGMDKLVLSSGLATLELPPGFVEEAAAAERIVLEIEQAEALPQSRFASKAAAVVDLRVGVGLSDGSITEIQGFSVPVTVKIPYIRADGDKPDTITVFHLAADGQQENMTGRYDADAGMVSFRTRHFSTFAASSVSVAFSDIADGHWASSYIEALAARGIVGGRGAETAYQPEAAITRAEFAEYLSKALGIVSDHSSIQFSDVDPADTVYRYIASASEAGIIYGMGNGEFGRDLTITRQDAATMLERAWIKIYMEKGAPDIARAMGFNDQSMISSYAVNAVHTAVWNGLMIGKPDNLFDPQGTITRAEAATVIYRLFNH